MSEPGERRRRRELHRNPETGDVQGAAPDPGSAAPQAAPAPARPETPVSRRAMRGPSGGEDTPPRGTAADASRSRRSIRDTSLDPTSSRPAPAGSGTPAWSTQPPVAAPTSRPAAPPATRPAAPPPPPRQAPSSAAPAISRPPAASRPAAPAPSGPATSRPAPSSGAPGQWGQRSAEPTGPAAPGAGWSASQERPTTSPQSGSAAPPVRRESPSWTGAGAGAAAGTVGSWGTQPSAPQAPAPQAPAPQQAPWQPAQAPAPAAQPAPWQSAPSAARAPAAPATSRPAPQPTGQPGWSGAQAPVDPAPDVAPAPAAWAPTGLSSSGTVPAPRAGGEPPAPTQASRPDRVGFGVSHDDDDDYDDDDDDYDERPRHPYTWLHLIVLALVAFVLGFLIVLLLSNNSEDDPGSTAAAPAATHVVAPQPS